MVSLAQFQRGFAQFLDNEIVSHMTGWQKWTFGALGGLAISRTTNLFGELKKNPIVAMLGVIREDDMIDIDTLYREFKRQAQMSPATFAVPGIGTLTLREDDVDKLYSYIINA